MSDTALFVLLFGGLFVLRVIAATVVFAFLLPQGDKCPICDNATARLVSPLSDRLLPWFRKRWCLRCGWTGMLRRGPLTEEPATIRELTRRR